MDYDASGGINLVDDWMEPVMTHAGLQPLDWIIIGGFFLVVLLIGIVASKSAGKSSSEFFLGGRNMPWWLLGISMVACTFSADTPNLVTGMVRSGGVAANWSWWAFLITGMVTVFIYAKLWRRSEVMTDLEFYEVRYSGKAATFLRGFRSIYLGFFFNCLIMGTVTLATIKMGEVILGLDPWISVVCASIMVVIYASLGGLKGVIWADFFQFGIAMFGAYYAAVISLEEVGEKQGVDGLTGLLEHPLISDKLSLLPDFSDPLTLIPLLIIPIAVQWWAVWYPGAEPGGGGYVAQRMLSARSEKHAIGATLLFNIAHYALRPWPWIIVALSSMVLYPDMASIAVEFDVDPKYLKNDIAYPVMLTKLGPGWLGLVVASLIAAYMSTIGTHLNWGASYVVNDFYKRFMNNQASEQQLVGLGRVCTVILMFAAGTLALTVLDSATQAFTILLLSGAGSGAIYLLRWFWWRINAWSELSAMASSALVALVLVFYVGEEGILSWVSHSAYVSEHVYQITDPDSVNFLQLMKQDSGEAEEELYQVNPLQPVNTVGQHPSRMLLAKMREHRGLSAEVNRLEMKLHSLEQAQLPTGIITQELNHAKRRLREYVNEKLTALDNTVGFSPVLEGYLDRVDFNESLDAMIYEQDRVILIKEKVRRLVFPVQLVLSVFVTTLVWVIVTLLTRPVDPIKLRKFYRLTHPGGPGWKRIIEEAAADGDDITEEQRGDGWEMPVQLLCVFCGCLTIYAILFAIGSFIYSNYLLGGGLLILAVLGSYILFRCFDKLRAD